MAQQRQHAELLFNNRTQLSHRRSVGSMYGLELCYCPLQNHYKENQEFIKMTHLL
jgi:hypothetical protein